MRFQTFGDPELNKVTGKALEWLEAYQRGTAPAWLTLLGESGTGKTHVGRFLWESLRGQADFSACDYHATAIYWPDFVDELRGGEAYGRFNDMKRWPVMFLDDIGAERDKNGFAAEKLNTLLGCRMDRWTILTSNLNHDEIHVIDARIADRMIRKPNICVGVRTQSFATR